MPLAATFQPAASSAARALAGSTRPGSDGFHAAVVSPCFPGFFTDSPSSQNSLCFAPLSSITTPCFPADTTLPERPPQDGRVSWSRWRRESARGGGGDGGAGAHAVGGARAEGVDVAYAPF